MRHPLEIVSGVYNSHSDIEAFLEFDFILQTSLIFSLNNYATRICNIEVVNFFEFRKCYKNELFCNHSIPTEENCRFI